MGDKQGQAEKMSRERKPLLDDVFSFRVVLAPWIWHFGVWICMFGMLALVGYLQLEDEEFLCNTMTLLLTVELDHAARRGALAFSGVTLAISVALSAAGFFWAWSAWKDVSDERFRVRVRNWVLASLAITFTAAVLAAFGWWGPFTAQLGNLLLTPRASRAPAAAALVPILMFLLSCIVPSVLLAGACFLLEPMTSLVALRSGQQGDGDSTSRRSAMHRRALRDHRKRIEGELAHLRKRLRDLDQMLYIGALALVYSAMQDAFAELGKPEQVRALFVGFQRHLYGPGRGSDPNS